MVDFNSYDQKKLKQAILDLVPVRYLEDVMNHGCSGGTVGGLIYYSDTTAFHDEHETAIWDIVYEDMKGLSDTDNLMEFIASWNGSKDVGSMEQFKNLLAWYTCETVCRWLVEELRENDIDLEDEEAAEAFFKSQEAA